MVTRVVYSTSPGSTSACVAVIYTISKKTEVFINNFILACVLFNLQQLLSSTQKFIPHKLIRILWACCITLRWWNDKECNESVIHIVRYLLHRQIGFFFKHNKSYVQRLIRWISNLFDYYMIVFSVLIFWFICHISILYQRNYTCSLN